MKHNNISLTYDHLGTKPHTTLRTFTQIISPNVCPKCFASIEPVYISSTLVNEDYLEITYLCRSCESTFISKYNVEYQAYDGDRRFVYKSLVDSFPKGFKEKAFHKTITETSPTFSVIYNQALQAESMLLDQISGVGFRKSLEFLVKDYAINRFPDEQELILSTSLVNCIKKYVTHPKIKGVIERTAWLGNDETHYLKVYNLLDVKTLKDLIDLSVNWIILDLYSDEVIESIPHPSTVEK